MGNIVLLDDLTINKIAAGEVIERPANVVKELVENSIDAGATSIQIETKKGGKALIKVSDNGKGISLEDMPFSLERHATSKIRNIEDLENTYTMGFRGEALASIASISNLTMISKVESSDVANQIKAKAGEIESIDEVAANRGTTIIVENLFFNTPVRYKFLKQDQTEFRYIKEWVQKAALVNTNISFKLINDGKVVFQSNGSGKIKDIIYNIYGKEIGENIVDVDYKEDNIKITGVVGNTRIAKDSRKDQMIFLNKRNIKNSTIYKSTDQAFKGATGIGKYGFFILNLEMPATEYDVNVHPTKSEVRFKDESKLYRIFYHAIKEAILSSEFLGNSIKEENKDYVENELNFLTSNYNIENSEKIEKKTTLYDRIFKNEFSTSKEVVDKKQEQIENIKREEKRKIDYKFIGISFRTYIIIEIDDEIYMIDQHAAHERILYEQIKANYKSGIQNNSQMMLIPEVITLSHKEAEFVKDNIELFRNIGFDLESFGENAIKINGIPSLDYKTNSKHIFMDILDEMTTETRTAMKDVEERFIATVACKSAVKAHMDLKRQEVDDLINGLLTLKNPYTCPHGRPTTIKINKRTIVGQLLS